MIWTNSIIGPNPDAASAATRARAPSAVHDATRKHGQQGKGTIHIVFTHRVILRASGLAR
jgi:hypothetical protein